MSLQVNTGRFDQPRQHHDGRRVRFFRFKRTVEVWIGARWMLVSW